MSELIKLKHMSRIVMRLI